MSLEVAIQENTAAIHALIAALGNGSATAAVAAPATTSKKKGASNDTPVMAAADAKEVLDGQHTRTAEEQDALVKSKDLSAQSEAPAQEPDPAASEQAAADNQAPAITYDDVKKAILDLSKTKGREAAVKVLSDFGVEKLPDLAAEHWAAVAAAAVAALEG